MDAAVSVETGWMMYRPMENDYCVAVSTLKDRAWTGQQRLEEDGNLWARRKTRRRTRPKPIQPENAQGAPGLAFETWDPPRNLP
jgi:hypothetical protein